MAINVATLSTTAYEVSNPTVIPVHMAGDAYSHDWRRARFDTRTVPGDYNRTKILFTENNSGDTIFLPYDQQKIHSVRLPAAAGGPTSFITAGMSGCTLFVDTIAGSSDLIVSHANYMIAGTTLNFEPPALTTALQAQHVQAQAYWSGPPHNAVLTPQVTFNRVLYNNSAMLEETRKRAQHRTAVQFLGGTTVIGTLTAGQWELHWQTYGDLAYRRPLFAAKRWTAGASVALSELRHEVIAHDRLYP